MTRKHWVGWAAVAIFAALCAVIFWPKSERAHQRREPASVEGPPVSKDSARTSAKAPESEPVVATALPEAPAETVPASGMPIEAEDSQPEPTAIERAQLARLPVIYAIRGDYPSEQARFEAMRGALQKSGISAETWTASARPTFERWAQALDGIEHTVDSGSLRCYVAGCEMLVTFRDRPTFEQGAAKFRAISDQIAMGRVQTPGVALPDGQVQVSWMLLRPDTAPPDAG